MSVSIIMRFVHLCFMYIIIIIIIIILGEALDRIKSTFILDKGIQSEVEIRHKDVSINQSITSKQEVPTANNYHTGTFENYNRMYAAVKALYNSKIEYKDN